jgi:hypothetical protein
MSLLLSLREGLSGADNGEGVGRVRGGPVEVHEVGDKPGGHVGLGERPP